MKIAIRAGHNFKAPGAKGILDETKETRRVKDEVIKYLREAKQQVLDVTPNNMGVNEDLKFGVSKANEWDADLFISIHFNKAYDTYNGAIGSECWTIGPGHATNIATRIVDSISKLGFKNRGVKHKGFYELRHTKMSAIIIEVCFVEATDDAKLYNELGVAKVAKSIAEGIVNAQIDMPQENQSDNGPIYRVKVDGTQIGAYREPTNAINKLKENWGNVEKIEIEKR